MAGFHLVQPFSVSVYSGPHCTGMASLSVGVHTCERRYMYERKNTLFIPEGNYILKVEGLRGTPQTCVHLECTAQVFQMSEYI